MIWLTLAVVYFVIERRDLLIPVLLIKASALISMWTIVTFVGEARWLALGVQAIVLLAGARLSRIRTAFALSTLVWGASLAYFYFETADANFFLQPQPLHTTHGALALLYLFASTALFTLHGRWLNELQALPEESNRENLIGLHALHTILLMVLSIGVLRSHTLGDYAPIETMAIALAMGGIGWGLGHWTGAAAAIAPIILAHAGIWLWKIDSQGTNGLLINGFIVVGLCMGVAFAARTWLRRRIAPGSPETVEFVQGALYLLWLPTLMAIYAKWLPPMEAALASAGTAVAMVLIAPRYPFALLVEMSILPICAILFTAMLRWASPYIDFPAGDSSAASGAAFLLMFAHACLATCWGPARARLQAAAQAGPWDAWVTLLATLAGLLALNQFFLESAYVAGVAVAGLLVALLARWPGLRPALWSGAFYLGAAHFTFYARELHAASQVELREMGSALIAAGLTVAFCVAARRLVTELSRNTIRIIQWCGGICGLLLSYSALGMASGSIDAWTSVCWGVTALLLFAVGFVDRARPLRIIALVGFALCIARAFIYDIDSVTDRIYAFIVLGAALMGIGYIYVRFRERLESWDASDAAPSDPPADSR